MDRQKVRPNMEQNAEFDFVMTMGEKMSSYTGEWICVVDGKVVAQGKNAKDVFREAKEKFPKKIPLVMKIPTDGVMLL